jgi:hypothetical protein
MENDRSPLSPVGGAASRQKGSLVPMHPLELQPLLDALRSDAYRRAEAQRLARRARRTRASEPDRVIDLRDLEPSVACGGTRG